MPEKKKYLKCGKIVNTHGTDGAVMITPLCDSAGDIASLHSLYFRTASGYEKRGLLSCSVHKSMALAHIDGVRDMNEAGALKDIFVYADRDELPEHEGRMFVADLIGLPVIDAESGRVYGKLSSVINRGASDIYVINTADGEAMLPAVPEFLKGIDDGGIYVSPPDGIFLQ